jgi:hypothetical protein
MLGCLLEGMPDYLEDIVGRLQEDIAGQHLVEGIVADCNSTNTPEEPALVVELHLVVWAFGDMGLPLGDLDQGVVVGLLIALAEARTFWP